MSTPGNPEGGLTLEQLEIVFRRLGIPTDSISATPLSGGVSSDIWKVQTSTQTFCVKQALPKLKVNANWHAPVSRNAYEFAYLRVVAGINADAVPGVAGRDDEFGLFVMEYFEPETHPVWKKQLLEGTIELSTAKAVGESLGSIHQATSQMPDLINIFNTDAIFEAIRIEPYLLATAEVHTDLADRLKEIAAETRSHKKVLVHGDISPKNILVGPKGPIFLDAECAWFGDPAFDIAFVLNHLLLKCVFNPTGTKDYLDLFETLKTAYFEQVQWEDRLDLEKRVTHLLPALFLARVDGKSPVEYLNPPQQTKVRTLAKQLLIRPPKTLKEIQAFCHVTLRK